MWSRGRILSRAVAPSRDLQASRGAACHVGRAPEQGQPGRGGQPGAGDGADPSAARRPQDRCVRASPAQMPARGNGNFLRYYDLSQLPCQISQVSELSLCLPPCLSSLPWIPIDPSDVLNYYRLVSCWSRSAAMLLSSLRRLPARVRAAICVPDVPCVGKGGSCAVTLRFTRTHPQPVGLAGKTVNVDADNYLL